MNQKVKLSRFDGGHLPSFASVLIGGVLGVAVGNASIAAFAADAPAPADQATSQPAQPRLDMTPVLSEKTVLTADVPYGGPDEKLDTLDIYAPKGAAKAPVLLFIHGGEWSRGDKKAVSFKPRFFNDNGVIFVSSNYRLSPKDKHPAQVDDVATAIAWLHTHVSEYGGDPDKIVIMGHSAGCHLVTLGALNPEPLAKVHLKPTDIRGVVAWSGGMYDLVSRAKGPGMYPPFIKATFGDSEEGQHEGSPKTYVANAKNSPPFLFASCDDDRSKSSREATDDMVSEINKAGGTAESTILVNRTHQAAIHEIGNVGDTTGQGLLQFMSKVDK